MADCSVGSLWGYYTRNEKYQTSFSHFYYEFQPLGRMGWSCIISLKRAEASRGSKGGKLHTSVVFQVETQGNIHLETLRGASRCFENSFQCLEGEKK
jgi:hypothetical protein